MKDPVNDSGDISKEIARLSQRFGTAAKVQRESRASQSGVAVIATWGTLSLEALDRDAIGRLANNQSAKMGMLVDFMGDFYRSARIGLPVYYIAGGKGFVWSASPGPKGKGHLNFAAADFRRFERKPVAPAVIASTNPQPIIEHATRPNNQSLSIADQKPERRVALIIGNSDYSNDPLRTPTNDTAMIAAILKRQGFDVLERKNLNREAVVDSLKQFASLAEQSDWALVYYAGHGIEYQGHNYIIPIGAELKSERDIEFDAIDVNKVLSAIDGAKRIKLLILDACRDNPFQGRMRRVASRSLARGLARMEPETGTLIVYAAKHGETASDGVGQNSPFAEALAKRLEERPNHEVRRLFDLVRDDVLLSTGKKQQPFSYGSLSGSVDFFFDKPNSVERASR